MGFGCTAPAVVAAAVSALKCTMRGFPVFVSPALFALLFTAACVTASAGGSVAPPPKVLQEVPSTGCTLTDGAPRCNLSAFQRTLAAARNVSIETQPMDRVTAAQLRRLVESLGKQLGTNDHPGTLVIALTPVEKTGITYGPGDHDLATLRVYAVDGENRRSDLLWAETLRGQGDRPWPAQVHDLIEQLEARLKQQ